jgi:hypothetical protein
MKFILNTCKLIANLVKMVLTQIMNKYLVQRLISCFRYLNPSNENTWRKFVKFHHISIQMVSDP